MTRRTADPGASRGDAAAREPNCPDAEDLAAFCEGRLDAAARAGIERHLAFECSQCRRIAAALAGSAVSVPARTLAHHRRAFAWLVAASILAGATVWWAAGGSWQVRPFDERLVAAAHALAAVEPTLAGLQPYSTAERAAAMPGVLRDGGAVALHHPRGKVLSDRPDLVVAVPPDQRELHVRVTAVADGAVLAEGSLPVRRATADAELTLAWPFAPLPRGAACLVSVWTATGSGSGDQQVVVVADAIAAAAAEAALAAIARSAPREFVPALQLDYALRAGLWREAEQAASVWLETAPDLPAAQGAAPLLRRR